mmetsp:Transcript_28831/g.66460  ORF Transcript_28831/g.66460 Transcript_28831/m.66460 type:complete len:203 (-) Transcript_28831:376-984(-)
MSRCSNNSFAARALLVLKLLHSTTHSLLQLSGNQASPIHLQLWRCSSVTVQVAIHLWTWCIRARGSVCISKVAELHETRVRLLKILLVKSELSNAAICSSSTLHLGLRGFVLQLKFVCLLCRSKRLNSRSLCSPSQLQQLLSLWSLIIGWVYARWPACACAAHSAGDLNCCRMLPKAIIRLEGAPLDRVSSFKGWVTCCSVG